MIQEGYKPLSRSMGYLLLKVPQDILNEIKISVDEIQSDFTKAIPHNQNLAGQIDKEYATQLTNKAAQYIKHAVEQYCEFNPTYIQEIYGQFHVTPKLKYEGRTWINFQEKYEYNPLHNHNGIFSYVIWYQIPFFKEDEVKYGAGKYKPREHPNHNGNFSFMYYDGEYILEEPLSVDKTGEGYMAVFPSSLMHQVYPFYTSDDYRITISGNVFLQG